MTDGTKSYAFFEEQLSEVQDIISNEFAKLNVLYEYGDYSCRALTVGGYVFVEVSPGIQKMPGLPI